MSGIYGFFDEYNWLSNFAPAKVVLDGVTYPTVEHAYQAAKTYNPVQRLKILACRRPRDAKRAGRKVDLRPDWEDVKLDVMKDLVRQKFEHPEYAEKLRATGGAYIEETNYWNDRFWGVCKDSGKNHLGKILMDVRSYLLSREAVDYE